jgi:predicted RNA polymerase sigma factor
LGRSTKSTVGAYEKAGFDVKGFKEGYFDQEKPSDKENDSNKAIALARQLAGLPEGSPEKAKAKQDLMQLRKKIVEANNAGK